MSGDAEEPDDGHVASAIEVTRLAEAVKGALVLDDQTQADVAARVGVSPKHLNQVLNGRSGLSWKLAERIVAACGQQLVVFTVPADVAYESRDWQPT